MAIRLIPKRLVGQTIRGIRNRLGQTQEQFAESMGVSGPDVVASWEEGRTQPDAGTLAKIAAMGLVDVLVFQDDTPADELPQLTPGEAGELRTILSRMEALLSEAREIADRAADRTVVEMLEAAASGHARAPDRLEADGAVTLAAEVTVKPRTRKAAGAGRAAAKSRGAAARGDGASDAKRAGAASTKRKSSTAGASSSAKSKERGGRSRSSSGSTKSAGARSKSRGSSKRSTGGGGSGTAG